MVCPVLAVVMGPGEVEERAMDMQLGIVLTAGAVGKCGAHQVRRRRPLDAVLGDTRIAAIAEHRVLQSRAGGGHRHAFDLGPHTGLGDGPQRGDALVHREGHIDARGAFVAARPLHQLARPVGGEAVVKALEVPGVDLAAVFHPEQALGVEPGPVGLLAGGVVLVRMPVGALALQVVLGQGHLRDRRYHRETFFLVDTDATGVIRPFFNFDIDVIFATWSDYRSFRFRRSQKGWFRHRRTHYIRPFIGLRLRQLAQV